MTLFEFLPTSNLLPVMLFTSIDHPAISCNDVRKLADWYCTHLGMTVVGGNDKEPPSLMLAFGKNMSGSMLELMPVKSPGSIPPAQVPQFVQGLRHFAIRVSDFEQAYSQLKAAGIKFLMDPAMAVGGGKIVSFRDLEGNEVQIVQR
jgi:catechol 2,3-dioxygenase-like lactoylglutathione lyase family enzyme